MRGFSDTDQHRDCRARPGKDRLIERFLEQDRHGADEKCDSNGAVVASLAGLHDPEQRRVEEQRPGEQQRAQPLVSGTHGQRNHSQEKQHQRPSSDNLKQGLLQIGRNARPEIAADAAHQLVVDHDHEMAWKYQPELEHFAHDDITAGLRFGIERGVIRDPGEIRLV
jgi:hypothetical protein